MLINFTRSSEPAADGSIVLGISAPATTSFRWAPRRSNHECSPSTWITVDPSHAPVALQGQMEAARRGVLFPALVREVASRGRSVVACLTLTDAERHAVLSASARQSKPAVALDAKAGQILGIDAIEPIWGARPGSIALLASQIAWQAEGRDGFYRLPTALRHLLTAAQGFQRHQASLPALATAMQNEDMLEGMLRRLIERDPAPWPKPPLWWVTYSLPSNQRLLEATWGLGQLEEMGPEIFEHILSERRRGQPWPTESQTLRDTADATLNRARRSAREFLAQSPHTCIRVRDALAPFATPEGWRMFGRAAVSERTLADSDSSVVALVQPGTDPRLSTLAAVALVSSLTESRNEPVLFLAENADHLSPTVALGFAVRPLVHPVTGASGHNPLALSSTVSVRDIDGHIRIDAQDRAGRTIVIDAQSPAAQTVVRQTLEMKGTDGQLPPVPPPVLRQAATTVPGDPVAERLADPYAQTIRDLTGIGLNDPVVRSSYL